MPDKYFESLGIHPDGSERDRTGMLREAYNKAHDIRKFEIEMYWKRSSYLWTVQAAALAGLSLLLTANMELLDSTTQHYEVGRIIVAAIWAFGTFSAFIWILMLRGAKFWQNNWERHVDFLEGEISGHLYKTYPVENACPPYSVTKLNGLMAGFTFMLWILVGLGVSYNYLYTKHWAIGWFVALFLAVVIFAIFEKFARMSDFIAKDPPSYEIRRRGAPISRDSDAR